MIDFIASVYVFFEAYWRLGLFCLIVFGVFWLFTNLNTDKPLGLVNQLFFGLWWVVKHLALGAWWLAKKIWHYSKILALWILTALRDLLAAFR